MEKFCIVKRRKQTVSGEQQAEVAAAPDPGGTERVTEIASYMPASGVRKETSFLEKRIKDGEQVIRIQLSPEQCKVARSNRTVKDLVGRTIGKVALDIEEGEDGQIVFNFHVKQVYGTKTLNPHDVCEMLQISKSFLSKLVKEGQMRSYKIGRLRRFLLEDILEYLTKSDELLDLLSRSPRADGGPRRTDEGPPEG
jgi:excisionase family DNA binding protein